MTHELKIDPGYFRSVWDGYKLFEIRKNDRGFCAEDVVILKEYDSKTDTFSGREVRGRITYVTDYRQMPGYVVFGFERI